MTGIVLLPIMVHLNEVRCIKKESALDAFKLFYEEMIPGQTVTNRIKRNRPATAAK